MPDMTTSFDRKLFVHLEQYPWPHEFYVTFISRETRLWFAKQSKFIYEFGNYMLLPLSCLRLFDVCDTFTETSALCIPRQILSCETLQFCGFRDSFCASMVLRWRSKYTGVSRLRHATLVPDRTEEIVYENYRRFFNRPILQGELVQQFRDLIVDELFAVKTQIRRQINVLHKTECHTFFRNCGLGDDLCAALVARVIHRIRRYPWRPPSTDELFELARTMVLERFDFLNSLESHFQNLMNVSYREYDKTLLVGIRHLIADGMVGPLLTIHGSDTALGRQQQSLLEVDHILDSSLWAEDVTKEITSFRDTPMRGATPAR